MNVHAKWRIRFTPKDIERKSTPPEILVSSKPLGEFNILCDGLSVDCEMFKGRIKEEFLDPNAEVHIDLNVHEHSHHDYLRFVERDIGYLREYVLNNYVIENIQTQFDSYNGNEFTYVCSRYVFKIIDDVYWGSRSESFELMAIREGKIIYIDRRIKPSLEFTSFNSSLTAFIGLKFGETVTTSKSLNKLNNESEKPWAIDNTHSVLRHVAIVQHDEQIVFNMAVAGSVRAFEEDDSAIEIHTKQGTFDDKFWWFGARKWWLNAKLSGAQRTFYGLRDDNNIVRKVGFVKTEDLLPPTGRPWKYDCNDSIRIIAKILGTVRHLLSRPRNTACIIQVTSHRYNKRAFVRASEVDEHFFDPLY